jgi:uncharacterized protein YifN (PemK superfamily)
LAIRFAPKPGTVVTVDFDQGFKVPEMVKRRLAVVISPVIKERGPLVTVVPLSTTAPDPVCLIIAKLISLFSCLLSGGNRRDG